ncbi:hypothetical protein [Crossiella sp. CA198]|uniref:hypothetical protein n=1 Tax=Crossiella sp. CA198 TaxID=3455607 RepID=UPI003F8D03A3
MELRQFVKRPLTPAEAGIILPALHKDGDALNCDVVTMAVQHGWHPVSLVEVVRVLDRFTYSTADSDDVEALAYIANAALDFLNKEAAPLGYAFTRGVSLMMTPRVNED